jgi:hypothetical protein
MFFNDKGNSFITLAAECQGRGQVEGRPRTLRQPGRGSVVTSLPPVSGNGFEGFSESSTGEHFQKFGTVIKTEHPADSYYVNPGNNK